MKWFRWWWLALLIPIIAGFARLHFDVEVLDLLPANVPAVQGLKIYQQHFTNARELIIGLHAPDRETGEAAAAAVARALARETNLVADATWQPPWLEHPDQTAELIAFLWLNQPPAEFTRLTAQLAETNLPGILAATRDQLATSLSPADIAQSSYDPFGLTRLPASVTGAAPGFGQGQELFASPDGTFRIIFVKARGKLAGYRECTDWLNAIKRLTASALPAKGKVTAGYTGRPAFVAEISGSMQHDIMLSVGGTSVIIALLFWLAMTVAGPRFVEYSVLLLALATALVVRDLYPHLEPWLNRRRGLAPALACVALAALLGFHLRSLGLTLAPFGFNSFYAYYQGEAAPPRRFQGVSTWMAANLAPGETVINLFWDDFPELFYDGYRQHYLWGLDPTYSLRDDRDVTLWLERQRTRVLPLNGPTLARVFHARYLVLRTARAADFPSLRQAPFREAYRDASAVLYAID